MGSKTLLLKQKEVGEMHASVFRQATEAPLPPMDFHTIDIAKKSFSELQVWLEQVLCINPGRSDSSVST